MASASPPCNKACVTFSFEHMILFERIIQKYFRSKFIIKPNKATQMEGQTRI